MGLIILFANAYSQESQSINVSKTAETYMDLMLNLVSTNINYGKENSTLSDYRKSILSPQVGVSFQAGVTPSFSIASELYFMTKGGKLESNNPLTTGKTILRFYSVELPLMARYHFYKFYINAGPAIGLNVHGTKKIEGTTTNLSFSDSNDAFKRWEASVQFGGGYTFRVKQKRVAIDVRYNYGLTNISNATEMYNRSFILSAHISKPWKSNPLGKKNY